MGASVVFCVEADVDDAELSVVSSSVVVSWVDDEVSVVDDVGTVVEPVVVSVSSVLRVVPYSEEAEVELSSSVFLRLFIR